MERMDGDSLLAWLQDWYERQCDGDWEHQYGVSIETLDNPGWGVKIDLRGTALDGQSLEWTRHDGSETNWFQYGVRNERFEAFGDPQKLHTILRVFRDWVECSRS